MHLVQTIVVVGVVVVVVVCFGCSMHVAVGVWCNKAGWEEYEVFLILLITGVGSQHGRMCNQAGRFCCCCV